MAEKKKLTDKEKGDIAFKNMAIQYIGDLHGKVSKMEKTQAAQAKYRSKTARSKGRANRAKAAKKARNLKGMASLDSVKLKGFGSSPLK